MRQDLYLIRMHLSKALLRFGARAIAVRVRGVFKRLRYWHKHAVSHSSRTAENSSARGCAMTEEASTKWFEDKMVPSE